MSFVFSPLAAAAGTSSAVNPGANTAGVIFQFVMIALIFVLFYFILIRPQRKREKDANKMRTDLQVGDEITTVGGVVGRVVTIKDDSIVLETGADRSKIRIKKWAVQSNDTVHEETK